MTHSVISIDSILLNSMRNGKIVILAASKETWLFAYYKQYINMKTKAQISCAVIAQLIHSFFVGYIAAQAP